MNSVRVGDYVKCVGSNQADITIGEYYEIFEISNTLEINDTYLIMNDSGELDSYLSYRFKPDLGWNRNKKINDILK